MITIRLNKWDDTNGSSHIATSYQVFKNNQAVQSSLLESIEETTEYIDIYYSKIVIPINTTYYVRYKRFIQDGNLTTGTAWSDLIPVTSEDYTNDIIDTTNIVLEEPVLKVNINSLLTGSNDLFKIETNTPINHDYTHWIIINSLGDPIYINKYDSVNKTSIEISKSQYKLLNSDYIEIFAIFGNISGIESKAARYRLDINNFNFTLIGSRDRLIPYTNYNLKFIIKDPVYSSGIYSISLLDKKDLSLVWSLDFPNSPENYIVIDGSKLLPNSDYIIDIYAVNTDGNRNVLRTYTSTISSTNVELLDLTYEYSNNIRELLPSTLPGAILPNLLTEQWFNNKIPIPNSNIYNLKLYKRGEGDNLISLETTTMSVPLNSKNTCIKLLENNKIIMDNTLTWTDSSNVDHNYVRVKMYDYNIYDDLYINQIITVRPDELPDPNYGSSFVNIDYKTMIILNTDGTRLIVYDIENNYIVNTITIPNNKKGAVLVKEDNDSIAIVGKDELILRYDLINNVFMDGTIIPLEFTNRSLIGKRLINNDYIIFRRDVQAGDTGVGLYYNHIDGSTTLITYDENSAISVDGIILFQDGEIRFYQLDSANNNVNKIYSLT